MVVAEEKKPTEKIPEYLGFQGLCNKMKGRCKEGGGGAGDTHIKQEQG